MIFKSKFSAQIVELTNKKLQYYKLYFLIAYNQKLINISNVNVYIQKTTFKKLHQIFHLIQILIY